MTHKSVCISVPQTASPANAGQQRKDARAVAPDTLCGLFGVSEADLIRTYAPATCPECMAEEDRDPGLVKSRRGPKEKPA